MLKNGTHMTDLLPDGSEKFQPFVFVEVGQGGTQTPDLEVAGVWRFSSDAVGHRIFKGLMKARGTRQDGFARCLILDLSSTGRVNGRWFFISAWAACMTPSVVFNSYLKFHGDGEKTQGIRCKLGIEDTIINVHTTQSTVGLEFLMPVEHPEQNSDIEVQMGCIEIYGEISLGAEKGISLP
ncbi:hypothetical protein B0H16DRAFT_1699052 [Mycena metata]|uniref:Uncharacterized protein n=1 Tax=Mycena metata TaxID=1033252 RepID=A0AAD7HMJ6_9AGAR|nr:hypothetical protein B0H16DRAFT_1699052 [Mycena metata]